MKILEPYLKSFDFDFVFVNWLKFNLTSSQLSCDINIPRTIMFAFSSWNLRLNRNKLIFDNNQGSTNIKKSHFGKDNGILVSYDTIKIRSSQLVKEIR